MEKTIDWADQTFGDAALGDLRRTRRLVGMAAGLCARPAGRLTRVYSQGAQREGAFRLIENDSVDPAEIARASHRATARRCAGESVVYVAVDSTYLSVVDRQHTKVGRIGPNSKIHGGVLAMSALAVDLRGTTLGTTALEYWVRGAERCPRWKDDRRPAEQRESTLWRRAVLGTVQVMLEHSPRCTPWFQMDRGADFADVLMLAHDRSLLVTVRATHNRAIESEPGNPLLWPHLRAEPVLGYMTVRLPAREDRPARTARLSLRAKKLRFRVVEEQRKRRNRWVELNAVYAEEIGQGSDRIKWMLWTTYPVQDAQDVCKVVIGYTMRWRIEDFHRAWKKGGCDIESTQLRSVSALQRWGAITAAVAARAEHLKLLSRAEPSSDAELVLSRDEIDAAIILTKTKHHRIGDKLTLQQAVWLIAQVGGYTGKSSGGPPGSQTIARGLQFVAPAATALAATRSG
jgi:hypothetical protein